MGRSLAEACWPTHRPLRQGRRGEFGGAPCRAGAKNGAGTLWPGRVGAAVATAAVAIPTPAASFPASAAAAVEPSWPVPGGRVGAARAGLPFGQVAAAAAAEQEKEAAAAAATAAAGGAAAAAAAAASVTEPRNPCHRRSEPRGHRARAAQPREGGEWEG